MTFSFKRLSRAAETDCSFQFDSHLVPAKAGESVAAALLAYRHLDVDAESTFKPYCLMGACYGCLVVIDGKVVQSCMVDVEAGLLVASVDATV